MELYNGRPADVAGREDREIRVYDLLDSLDIEYFRTDHGHADTMEACNEIDAVLDRLPTAEIVDEDNGIYTIIAETFGNGIDMWLRSQGKNVQVINEEI